MILHKVVIGIVFNRKIFKLSSLGGTIADELLKISETSASKGGIPFFDKLVANNDFTNFGFTLLDSKNGNSIEVHTSQIVFNRLSPGTDSALNMEKALEDFIEFYKPASKILGAPAVRRIGIVGEHIITQGGKSNSASSLVKKLSKIEANGKSDHFHLTFNDLDISGDLDSHDPQKSDFWNYIYSIYPSERDASRPTLGQICVNLDVQKYYNPAKSDAAKEIKIILSRFKERKAALKQKLQILGITDE